MQIIRKAVKRKMNEFCVVFESSLGLEMSIDFKRKNKLVNRASSFTRPTFY